MNDNAIDYDDSTHTYTVAGRVVPHVTAILSRMTNYSDIPKAKLEIARQKGVAVHRMVELDVAGDLDEDGLPEWLRPVLEQWRKFCTDTGAVVFASERRVYHPTYQYAGTLDLEVEMRGKRAIVDIKRSLLAGRVIGMQLAAYELASRPPGKQPARRFALRLHENGPYRLEPFADSRDYNDFVVCLAYHKLKQRVIP